MTFFFAINNYLLIDKICPYSSDMHLEKITEFKRFPSLTGVDSILMKTLQQRPLHSFLSTRR